MNPKIRELLDRIARLEDEMEQEFERRRRELHTDFENHRVRFEREVLEQQRRFKRGIWRYLRESELRHVLSAPLIFAVSVPLVLLDIFVTLYQWICFPLYRIPRVRRRDYFFFDRSYLAYLNIIEKLNCAYCSYANGLIAYVREIAGRTEQYWCPIKHARRIYHAHPYYGGFVDFGDAQAYAKELKALREALTRLEQQSEI